MDTQEIAKSEWTAFFKEFSERHEGKMATLQLLGADIGAQAAASNLPFVGVTTDVKGSETSSIAIILGTESENNFQHTLTTPTVVRVKSGEGASEALEIESDGDPISLLTFAA